MGTININSIPSKFDEFKLIVSDLFDVIIETETKLDHSFLEAQFCIDEFSIPYRLDLNRYDTGRMIYVRDDIPIKMLAKHSLPEDNKAAEDYKFLEMQMVIVHIIFSTFPKP